MNKRDKITQTTDVPQELVFVKYKLNTSGPYSVKYRGYEYSLLRDELTERDKLFLLCSICEGVMIEATMCGATFSCDVCVPSGSDVIPVFATRKTISELSSRCPLYLRGCKWVGTLATVLNHVEKCYYLFTACSLRCGDAMLQKNILEHVKSNCNRIISCDLCYIPIVAKCLHEHLDACPQSTIQCNECQENLFRKDLSDHNSNICLYRPVECRYAKYGCQKKLFRKDLSDHISNICLYRPVECRYAKYGCQKKLFRKDLSDHISNICLYRLVECRYAKYGCQEKLFREDLSDHTSNICLYRPVECRYVNMDVEKSWYICSSINTF